MTRMMRFFFAVVMAQLAVGLAFGGDVGTQLFMSDGQLKSHPVRVFVTWDLSEASAPKLQLTASHAITEKKEGESELIPPQIIARHQQSIQTVNGVQVTLTGTLLVFDLRNYPIPPYKATMRLLPILTWKEIGESGEEKRFSVGAKEIYLANPVPAFVWTAVLVLLLVLIIGRIARRGGGKSISLLCEGEHLSLSKTQIATWTLAIGGVVAGYGLIRLDVPRIPESLVALMGLSLVTGGISYLQGKRGEQAPQLTATPSPAPVSAKCVPNWSDLICDFSPTGERVVSLSRAQMVFWTCLTLVLFMLKSTMDGELWAVPWEMVALMGLSQASYLAPKLLLDEKTAAAAGEKN